MPTRYGYICIADPDKGTLEFDAYCCCHCQRICAVQPPIPGVEGKQIYVAPIYGLGLTRTQEQGFLGEPGYCQDCDQNTCGRKECVTCIPVEARLEAEEGTRRFWKQTEILTK